MAFPQGMFGRQKAQRTTASTSARASRNAVLTAADYKGLPLLRKPDMEAKLVAWVMDRMAMSSTERDRRAQRCEEIDIQMSGFIKHSDADKKRARDNRAGKSPKPTDHNLPLSEAQIDAAVTYLMSVFAPEADIFEALAPADKQLLAQALTAMTNKQGQRGQYYRNFVRFCSNAMKYNFGAMTCYWEEYEGIVFRPKAGGVAEKETGKVWSGNALNCADTYNFFFDNTVHPVDLPLKGEYFAEVFRKTPFQMRKMAQDKQLFGIDRFIDQEFITSNNPANNRGLQSSYYRAPPSVREDGTTGGEPTNWQSLLRAGADVKESSPGMEKIQFTGWICPEDFGLSEDKDLQMWRIRVVNGQWLAFAARLEDSHGMLPVVCACPIEDDLKNEQRTYPERLFGLQHYASFLLNTDQAATRKSIFGITLYNPNFFPGVDFSKDDLIGGHFPFRSSSSELDVDKIFRHYNDAPNTDANVDKLEKIIQLMQIILPTDTNRQVADLERATLYQAAATVQSGDRRNLKIARMISDQALVPLKFQMIYNIYANMTSISFIDPNTGQRQEVSVAKLIEAEIEFDIGTGLKGLDRLMQIQIMKDVLNAVIQSPEAMQEIDIVRLLNYFSTLAGDRTDLTQFRRQAPPPGAPGAAPVVPGASPSPQLGSLGVAQGASNV